MPLATFASWAMRYCWWIWLATATRRATAPPQAAARPTTWPLPCAGCGIQPSPVTLILYGISMGAVAILRSRGRVGHSPHGQCVGVPLRLDAANSLQPLPVAGGAAVSAGRFAGVLGRGAKRVLGLWAAGRGLRPAGANPHTCCSGAPGDPRVTRAETAAIFRNLAGPKARVDFVGCGHEPYWGRYPAAWRGQVGRFLFVTVPPPLKHYCTLVRKPVMTRNKLRQRGREKGASGAGQAKIVTQTTLVRALY